MISIQRTVAKCLPLSRTTGTPGGTHTEVMGEGMWKTQGIPQQHLLWTRSQDPRKLAGTWYGQDLDLNSKDPEPLQKGLERRARIENSRTGA